MGPTASGKSSLGFALAKRFQGEIISADSMQCYRRLDIGTAKPSREERQEIPHYLIDILDPDQDYNVALFRQQADAIIQELEQRKVPILVVGGTGLYLKVLTRGLFRGPHGDPMVRLAFHQKAAKEGCHSLYQMLQSVDPEAARKIHPRDKVRIIRALEVFNLSRRTISNFQREHGFQEAPYEVLKIGLHCEKNELYKRIEDRVEKMLAMGWVDEINCLLEDGYNPAMKSLNNLGYKHLVSYLLGKMNLQEAIAFIKRDTRRYAKRQITWFKNDPDIHWFSSSQDHYLTIEKKVKIFFRRSSF